MNVEEVWWSLTRSRRTGRGSRFCLRVLGLAVGLEGPAWDDEARTAFTDVETDCPASRASDEDVRMVLSSVV